MDTQQLRQTQPRPNASPPYYLGQPAGLWIRAMSRRGSSGAAGARHR
jgi:hypothetical protein